MSQVRSSFYDTRSECVLAATLRVGDWYACSRCKDKHLIMRVEFIRSTFKSSRWVVLLTMFDGKQHMVAKDKYLRIRRPT